MERGRFSYGPGACFYLLALASLAQAGCSDTSRVNDRPIERVSFEHELIDAAPLSGVECCTDVMALGDLDGDGDLDVVLGSQGSEGAGLVWYETPSWKRHAIANGEFTTDGQVWDMNRDGAPDVLISDVERGTLWYENPGQPGVRVGESWRAHPIAPGYAHDLELGDLDGDGAVEVIVTDKKELTVWKAKIPTGWRRIRIVAREGEGLDVADLDEDGDLDIVFGGAWFEAPEGGPDGAWTEHSLGENWSVNTRARVADVNQDGRPDIVLSVSEGSGQIAWFESPPDPRQSSWQRHNVSPEELSGAHSLQVGDFDGDGDLDIATAEMHTSEQRRVQIFFQEPEGWFVQTLSREGSHNMRAADLDGDGDLDLVGKNFGGQGRVVELWRNLAGETLSLDRWEYSPIDRERPDSQLRKMGLAFGDLDGDARLDVVAGSLVYLNPGTELSELWERRALPGDVDVLHVMDVDGDDHPDLMAVSDRWLLWIEAIDPRNGVWESRKITDLPDGRTQGHASAQLIPGDRPELIFTRGNNLFVVEIPTSAPESGRWSVQRISDENEEEGVAAADLDGDGDLDIVAHDADGHHVVWFENPGEPFRGHWMKRTIGSSNKWLDRIAVADVDRDGSWDILASEETRDDEYNARIYWFEGEANESKPWTRHALATLRSVNSMDVADMDGDADLDIIAAEHTDFAVGRVAPDNLTLILENQGNGASWIPHVVDRGPRSSHLGARVADLDADGDLEIVSIGWGQYSVLHLWINRAREAGR